MARADRMTDPGQTRLLAERVRQLGGEVTLREIDGEGHAMLRRPALWHRLAARFTVDTLLGTESVKRSTPNSYHTGGDESGYQTQR